MRWRSVEPASVISLGAMALVLVVGIGYMGFGVLQLNPFRDYIDTRLLLPSTGGLGDHSPVLLTGVEVGKVSAVRKTAAGVEADLRIGAEYKIPAASAVRIENLSALGEPYLEFTPNNRSGPYLRNGEVIQTGPDAAPMSIPEVSARLVKVLDQFDPKAVSSLVGTLNTALAGTESEIPRLQRSTTLLAAAVLSRTDTIHQLLVDLQIIGGDMDWTGPGLAQGGMEFGQFGGRVESILDVAGALFEKRDAAEYLNGDGVVPFLERARDFLNRTGPGLAGLAPVLQPLTATVAHAGSGLDVSALIAQALAAIGDDGALRLQLDLK